MTARRARALARRRRRWLGRLSVALLFLGFAPTRIGPAAPAATDRQAAILVTVAEVHADRAVLWVRTATDGPVGVRVAPVAVLPAARQFEAAPAPDWDRIIRIPLGGLAPGTRYAYEITTAQERVEGSFATAPGPAADVPAHVLWSGDLGGGGHCRDVEDGYPIFHAMARRRADLFVFVGDTVYADQVCGGVPHTAGSDFVALTLEEYRAKHRYNRADPAVQALLRVMGVYAIWDDHEVRNNFAGPDDPLMPIGRRAFRDYWAVDGGPEEPDRLYRSVRWGRHLEIFVLDTRQYRSSPAMPDGPEKTMLGGAQRRWLLDAITRSTATWKVIVSTVPLGMFTGGTHSDSWSGANMLGYPRPGNGYVWERDLILRTLREEHVSNVVFLSGEVHHAELIRHELDGGYRVHEFVAGPLAARAGFPRFLDRSLGSRSLGALGFTANFGEIVADGESLVATIRDRSGAARRSVRLTTDPTSGGHIL